MHACVCKHAIVACVCNSAALECVSVLHATRAVPVITSSSPELGTSVVKPFFICCAPLWILDFLAVALS